MNINQVLFSFKGRISRREYWLKGMLPALGIGIPILIAPAPIGEAIRLAAGPGTIDEWGLKLIIRIFFGILLIFISLAIFTKRWHDLGQTAWWSLVYLIPIFGWPGILMFIYLGIARGQAEENEYGPVPGRNHQMNTGIRPQPSGQPGQVQP